MAKFTRTGMSTSTTLLPNSEKIMARQPIRKLILANNLRFKNSSYNASKKHRKTTALRGTKIVAKTSNKGFISIKETTNKARRASSRVISILVPYLLYLVIPGLSLPSYAVVIVVVVVVVVTIVTALFLKLLRVPRNRKWLKNRFKCLKFDKDKPNEARKTSAADLFWTLDANTFENFVCSMSVLLAWWVLSRLISFVRRFYSEVVVRK